MKVYIGWTGEGALAYEVCRASLLANASIPVEVIPLRHWELRDQEVFSRPYVVTSGGQRIDSLDGLPHSTDFSYTRFLVPCLDDYEDRWSLFCDNDMLWLDDVADLLKEVQATANRVAVVKHDDYKPALGRKMTGYTQSAYRRKNWSSMMAFQSSRCVDILTPAVVNSAPGSYLHQFKWCEDDRIGTLSSRWNVLHGEQHHDNPAVVHFTNGTPDMAYRPDQDEWSTLWLNCAAAVRDGAIHRVREVIEENRS